MLNLSIVDLKEFLTQQFHASDSFSGYLSTIISVLADSLKVELTLMNKEYNDEILCQTSKFGAIDSLKRSLRSLAEAAAYKATIHPDWAILAGRIEILVLKLVVPETFDLVLEANKNNWNPEYYSFCKLNADKIEKMIDNTRDYMFYYFGVKTLEKSYLAKNEKTGGIIETPQLLYMRVATYLWMPDLDRINVYYDYLSKGYLTHASPTLFNCGLRRGALASCYLLSMQDDLEQIFECLCQCAMISKATGGIGLDITNIRHSKISHSGDSSGIIPMLKVYDATMRYVDQCFAPNTIVYTKKGPKPIAQICAGDKLLNINGEFGTVAKPMHYTYDAKVMYQITIDGYHNPVFVAGIHPIFIVKGKGMPSFCRVQDIIIGDKVVIPVPRYTQDYGYTCADCYMYGLLIRDGHACKYKNSFKLLTCIDKEFVENYLKIRNIPFEYTSKVQFSEYTDKLSQKFFPQEQTYIKWCGGAQFPFNRKMLYNGNDKKRIHHSMIHLPQDKTDALLDGIGTNALQPNIIETLQYINLRFEHASNEFVMRQILDIHQIEYEQNSVIELEMTDQKNAHYLTCIGLAHNGGRRKGSATIFIQPWHIDFYDFIFLKRNHGAEERRARDLFYSVWNCDIFMERVESNKEWTMFCPNYASKLKDTFGDEFDKWYLYYEDVTRNLTGDISRYVKKMNARDIWNELLKTQIETGMPFMTNKDTANYTSNQKNLGLIRSSNLCQEIIEVSDGERISSCNLASIALDEFVNTDMTYNYDLLGQITREAVRGLNQVIDRTEYPLAKKDNPGPIKSTNLRYRPLGLGIQALADTFAKLGISWESDKATHLNKEIFATIYYYAVDESVELAKVYGSYEGFEDSPAAQGLLKPHLMCIERARRLYKKDQSTDPDVLAEDIYNKHVSKTFDWDALANKVKMYGLRNSLLIALMPTASSAQIRNKNESFEPFTSNIYVRSVLSGNHVIVNKYMVQDFEKLGLWNKNIINYIIKNDGSIQDIPLDAVPQDKVPELQRLKNIYKTVFEYKQKRLIDLSIDRAFYICQSQSLNIHIKSPTIQQLTSLHFYAWNNALTTGMYYLRSAPSTEAIKFTVDDTMIITEAKKPGIVCTDDVCIMCQA